MQTVRSDTCWLARILHKVVSTAKAASDCGVLREDCMRVSDLYFSSLPFPLLHHRHSISLHPFTARTFWFCSSLSPPPGKILFRRSHVRDVAMKRLRFIDDYCRVKRPFCQHPSVPHLTVGKVPPPPGLLGVKGHSPYCPFTCSKHESTELLWRGGAVYLRLQRAPTLKRCESVKGSAWCCDLLLLQLGGCLPPCVPRSQTQGDLVVHQTAWNRLWALSLLQSPSH